MNDVANAPLSASLMTGYAAATLEAAGHEVAVVEGHLGGLDGQEVVGRAAASEPDLLGVHLVYDWSDGRHVARLLADLRAALGPLPIVLYGFYPTFAWDDAAARGTRGDRGDRRRARGDVVEVAAAPSRGRASAAVATCPPLSPRCPAWPCAATDGRPRLTAARPPIADLDALPFPRRTPEMSPPARGQHRRQPRLLRGLHVLHHQPVLRRALRLAAALSRERDRRDRGGAGRAAVPAPLLLRGPQLLRPRRARARAGAQRWRA